MVENEGKRLHTLAETSREQGNSLEALKYTDEALLAYQTAGNKLGMAEVLSSRSITFRHLWQKTEDKSYLTIAKANQTSAIAIARESGDARALAIPLFQLANVQEALGEFPEAVATYQEALTNIINNPPETHNRPAVIADFKIHLATCEYKAGDKSVLSRAEAALAELEEAEEPDVYAKDVWISGGYMRLAEIVKTDDTEKAKTYLEKAKNIIDANPKLTIRKQQFDKLAKSFN